MAGPTRALHKPGYTGRDRGLPAASMGKHHRPKPSRSPASRGKRVANKGSVGRFTLPG
jgi:hypothetical protein